MSTLSTVAAYAGRGYDLCAFRGIFPPSPGLQQLLAQALAQPGDGGAVIAGFEKLIQKVLVTLLTIKGSNDGDPNYGTTFMADAARGPWRSTADVQLSFSSAELDMRRQLEVQQLSTDPADEVYGSVSLTGVVLAGNSVTLGLQVVSAAGASFTFLTPLTVTPRGT